MKIGIYVRVSTEEQGKMFSPKTQREKGIKFCNEENYEWEIFEDHISGKNLKDRDSFLILQDKIENNEIQGVWVIEFSRLTRDESDAQFLREIFTKNDCRFWVNNVEWDLNDKDSILLFGFQSLISAYERRTIRERTMRGKRKMMDEGKTILPIILGFDLITMPDGKRKVVINETEAECVRFMFNSILTETWSLKKLAREVATRGYIGKLGSKNWSDPNISALLRQTIYKGFVNDSKGGIVKSVYYEPLISEEDFDQVDMILKTRWKTGKAKTMRLGGVYPLSGILCCNECNTKFYYNYTLRKESRVKQELYKHERKSKAATECKSKKYISRNYAEVMVFLNYIYLMGQEIQSGKFFKELEIKKSREENDLLRSLERIDNQIEEYSKKKNNLINAISMGIIDNADAKENMIILKSELLVLERSKNDLSEKINSLKLMTEKEKDIFLGEAKKIVDFNTTDLREFYLSRFSELKINKDKIFMKTKVGLETEIDITELKKNFDKYNLVFKNISKVQHVFFSHVYSFEGIIAIALKIIKNPRFLTPGK